MIELYKRTFSCFILSFEFNGPFMDHKYDLIYFPHWNHQLCPTFSKIFYDRTDLTIFTCTIISPSDGFCNWDVCSRSKEKKQPFYNLTRFFFLILIGMNRQNFSFFFSPPDFFFFHLSLLPLEQLEWYGVHTRLLRYTSIIAL